MGGSSCEVYPMIRLARIALNAVAIIGGAWLLLAVFAAGYTFY